MAKYSRNGTKRTERFFCVCGGEIKMITLGKNGKMRHMARCTKCGAEKRKVRELVA